MRRTAAILVIMVSVLCGQATACENMKIKDIYPNPVCIGGDQIFEADSRYTYPGLPRWRFDCADMACAGGGAGATGMRISHSYDTVNTYFVTARVTDVARCGETTIDAKWVVVSGVWSISSEGVVSYTNRPGTEQTVRVSRGIGTIWVSATPYLSWPAGKPEWSSTGTLTDVGEGVGIRGFSTDTAGTYTVTVSCGQTSRSIFIEVGEPSAEAEQAEQPGSTRSAWCKAVVELWEGASLTL